MPGFKPTMHEWKEGTLHSGSKRGPIVTSQRQAEAIAFSEQGERRKPKNSKKKRPAKGSVKIRRAFAAHRSQVMSHSHEED